MALQFVCLPCVLIFQQKSEMQLHDDVLHPIAYVSKSLDKAQRNHSTNKKEALALLYAVEQFRHMILCFEINAYTDHKPLLGSLKRPTKDQ